MIYLDLFRCKTGGGDHAGWRAEFSGYCSCLAPQGMAFAPFMYATSQGVSENHDEARKRLEKAVDQGYAEALSEHKV